MADWRAPLVWRLRALVRPPVTLGVRTLVQDTSGRILLVRHTYLAGWHLPGGGVDAGESAREAARRETAEETGVVLAADLRLAGLFLNEALARRDHVALYTALGHPPLDAASLKPAALEIAEALLVAPDALPEAVTAATRRRIDEVVHGAPQQELW